MRIIKCDLCKKEVIDAITITALDGEHPHNGSTMYRDIDCCMDCARKIRNLRCDQEWTALRQQMNITL